MLVAGPISTCIALCVCVCAEAELCPRVQYDFTMEDVPERDPRQVDSATEDTSEILTLLKEEMVCCLFRNYLYWINCECVDRHSIEPLLTPSIHC